MGDNADLWTHYIYTILADPEMPMWTMVPKTPVVSHVATVPAGPNTITVTVTVSGVPKAGVTVCLWKNLEDYQSVMTNGAGQATFSFNTPTAGPISVVATADNMVRYQGTINVNGPTGAMPVIESIAVDDDSIGGTSGNETHHRRRRDHRPQAGGAQQGRRRGPATTASLTSISGFVSALDAPASVPSIPAGALVNATDTWRIHVSPNAPMMSQPRPTRRSSAARPGSAIFSNLHAPKLEVTALRKSDQAPVGNGNGIITNGEQFLLYATIKNLCTGQADGLTAVPRAQSGARR